MGCGISKSDLKSDLECQTLRKITNTNIDISESQRSEHVIKDESNSNHRKSVSLVAGEGGFLRKVIGSNQKEGGVERELEPNFSLKEDNVGHKKPRNMESLEKDDDHIAIKRDNEVELMRPSNVDDCSSILLSPGSPSFRVYCAGDDEYIHVDSASQEDGDEAKKDSRSSDDGEKEMRSGLDPTGRRGRRFRNGMFRKSRIGIRAGSLRRKALLKCHPTSTKSISKPSD